MNINTTANRRFLCYVTYFSVRWINVINLGAPGSFFAPYPHSIQTDLPVGGVEEGSSLT